MTKTAPTEKAIENTILTYLNYLPKCFAWKNNSTGIYDTARGCFRKSKNRFAINGVSDILGIYHGRVLAIEVKKSIKSKVSKEQRDFIERINRLGGIAGVCASLEDAKQLIKESGGGMYEEQSRTEGVSE